MRKLFRRILPNARNIKQSKMLAWMGASVHHPRLWHVSREGIARGAAIGLFFGLLVPFGQMPLAAGVAFLLHANLPMAVAGTFVTNPFTSAAIYYFAYRLGLLLIGADSVPVIDASLLHDDPQQVGGWFDVWSERIVRLGKPLFVGLFTLASISALLSYFGISWLWRVLTIRAWRGRRKNVKER
jgi:uncharacterized protein (DUF2062 family)